AGEGPAVEDAVTAPTGTGMECGGSHPGHGCGGRDRCAHQGCRARPGVCPGTCGDRDRSCPWCGHHTSLTARDRRVKSPLGVRSVHRTVRPLCRTREVFSPMARTNAPSW